MGINTERVSSSDRERVRQYKPGSEFPADLLYINAVCLAIETIDNQGEGVNKAHKFTHTYELTEETGLSRNEKARRIINNFVRTNPQALIYLRYEPKANYS